jgi:hypothetical protein
VVINATMASQPLAEQLLVERMKDLNPRITPYGGLQRRVILEIEAESYTDAAERCMKRLREAFADWNGLRGGAGIDLSGLWVMHSSLDEPAPSELDIVRKPPASSPEAAVD